MAHLDKQDGSNDYLPVTVTRSVNHRRAQGRGASGVQTITGEPGGAGGLQDFG